mmetsp:Transcript_32708/g.87754  ORF Transcript_32708/g.87754 Transcript_32708/m.87754 type:complete len:318 (-) Transcript_32708:68-1021(-)
MGPRSWKKGWILPWEKRTRSGDTHCSSQTMPSSRIFRVGSSGKRSDASVQGPHFRLPNAACTPFFSFSFAPAAAGSPCAPFHSAPPCLPSEPCQSPPPASPPQPFHEFQSQELQSQPSQDGSCCLCSLALALAFALPLPIGPASFSALAELLSLLLFPLPCSAAPALPCPFAAVFPSLPLPWVFGCGGVPACSEAVLPPAWSCAKSAAPAFFGAGAGAGAGGFWLTGGDLNGTSGLGKYCGMVANWVSEVRRSFSVAGSILCSYHWAIFDVGNGPWTSPFASMYCHWHSREAAGCFGAGGAAAAGEVAAPARPRPQP